MTIADRVFVAFCTSLILGQIMSLRTKSWIAGTVFTMISWAIIMIFSYIIGM